MEGVEKGVITVAAYIPADFAETLAESVPDTYGCYFVPAFSGLFCPYWRSDARGLVLVLKYRENLGDCMEAFIFYSVLSLLLRFQ